ncbi:hypothetical protein KR018_000873 [Drosophila ironensis]|nr:hypothetical protein KR018_000873 [Drosophila ironensis]
MRAGKKQEADSGKTRPCIVYVKNIKEDAKPVSPPATARLRNRTTQQQQQQQQQQQSKQQHPKEPPKPAMRGRRRSIAGPGPAFGSGVQGVALRNRTPARRMTQIVAASPPAALKGPGATPRGNSALMAKRRSTAVSLSTPVQKGGRPAAQTSPYTPKVFGKQKQPVAFSPPPTIAASRSRRSIKPNPKYTSEDMVTPKYFATLGGESAASSSPATGGSKARGGKQLYSQDDDLLDLEEDDDDELADAAFNPQLHKSDEDDDDDEDVSEAELQQELRRLKNTPAVKRGRGRPPKSTANTPASSAAAATAAAANPPKGSSPMVSAGGRTGPGSLQQMRRNLAGTASRATASLADSTGRGAKRKLETSDSESPVASKRIGVSSSGRGGPVANGATGKAAGATSTRPRASAHPVRVVPQSSSVRFKVNTSDNPNITRSSGAAAKGAPAGASTGSGSGSGSGSSGLDGKQSDGDEVPTFTIVNINDIINQDDVLITKANINAAAAAAAATGPTGGGSTPGKKLSVGRPRTRGMPHSPVKRQSAASVSVSEKSSPSTSSQHTPSSNNASPSGSSGTLKRMRMLSSFLQISGPSGTSGDSGSGSHRGGGHAAGKPRPRILNAEMGGKAQPMKPLMSMGKELCPTEADTEEEDPDLDLDFDEDVPSSPVVTRRAPRAAAGARGGSASGSSPDKWNSNNSSRRGVLSTTTASTANSRSERKSSRSPEVPASRFKKPAVSPQRRSKENVVQQQQQLAKEEALPSSTDGLSDCESPGSTSKTTISNVSSPNPKYFPPATTTFCEEDGRMVKKITCYETWHVISTHKEPLKPTRQHRTSLELSLVKLANVANRIRVPSGRWSSKVTLYKVSPAMMQRHSMTVFTGDLRAFNIEEDERHKYQPSCVLFRRLVVEKAAGKVPYDRAIIFKNKSFYANIDGKHVNLLGAPDKVSTVRDVEILLDVVDRLSLESCLVELVNAK